MEPNNKISTELSQKSIDPVSFFSKNNDFVMAYKKAEKLASAVYMVTGLFSDSEPMKWTLRKKVGELLSFILTYKDTPDGGLTDYVYEAKTKATELISLMEVSLRGGLISQMNFSILKQEFLNLITILSVSELTEKDSSAQGISKTFFDVPQNYLAPVKTEINPEKIAKYSEQISRIQPVSLSPVKDIHPIPAPVIIRDNYKKTNRQTIILDLIRKKGELTINDIALIIKDCSEKTIQRELNSFIAEGVLKRSGVRRWSKYSLA